MTAPMKAPHGGHAGRRGPLAAPVAALRGLFPAMQPRYPADFSLVDATVSCQIPGRAVSELSIRSACGGKDLSRGASFEKVETMRMAAVLYRNVRRLSTMSSQGSSGLVAKLMAGRKDTSSAIWNVESRGTGGARVQLGAMSRVGVVRFMGFGTFNEEHKNAEVPHDESEDEVDDDEHPEVTIEKASHELFRQSNSVVETGASNHEEFQVKEHHREKPHADIASEVWSAKEQDGTSVFSDESDKATSEG